MKNKKEKEKIITTEEETKPSETLTSIVEVNVAKRTLAAFLDLLIAIFTFFLLAMEVMVPIANATLHYNENVNNGQIYQTSSHLFMYEQTKENGEKELIHVKDYTEKLNPNLDARIVSLSNNQDYDSSLYLDNLRYYYLSFLTGENVEMPNDREGKHYDMVNDHFVSPDYQENVKDTTTLPKDYYTENWFNKEILKVETELGQTYFSCPDLSMKATIAIDISVAENKAAINKYLCDLIYTAMGDMYYRPYYVAINNAIKSSQLLVILPPFFLVLFVYYLIIPLIMKNGETLAKKFLKIALVNKDGYAIKKRQTIYRFSVFLVWSTLFAFIVGIGTSSLATLGFGYFIMFVWMLIDKKHRCPQDLLAMTQEVDANKSVWFIDAKDEQKHNDSIKAKMDRYKSTKFINSNIIQIDGKILDENLAKEVEENQKTKK